MAKGSRSAISKVELNNVMRGLPMPIQEHSMRCKRICEYLLERAKPEDWFIDSGLNEDIVKSAVYYHDIGKANIPLDDIYAEFCSNTEQFLAYQQHTTAGINLIEKMFGIVLISYPERTFEKELFHAVNEHHERLDGGGFPNKIDLDTLSVTGKICAVIDTFDSFLYASNFDIPGSIEKLEKLSGRYLDEDVIDTLLGSPETLTEFVAGLSQTHERKRSTDKFGMKLMFEPVYDLVETNEYRRKIIAYRAEMWINDPFFGIVKPDAYLVAAEKTGQVYKLEKLALDKLIRLLRQMREDGNPTNLPIFYNISFTEFEKPEIVPEKKKAEPKNPRKPRVDQELVAKPGDNRLLAHLKRATAENGVDPGRIVLSLHEGDIVDSDFDINLINKDMHGASVNFAIENFAGSASVIPLLDKANVDFILMNRDFPATIGGSSKTFNMLKGLVTTLHSLELEPIFLNVTTPEEKALLIKAGARYSTAPLYCQVMTDKEFVKFVKAYEPEGATS